MVIPRFMSSALHEFIRQVKRLNEREMNEMEVYREERFILYGTAGILVRENGRKRERERERESG